jgi:hypothetical protein
MENSRCSSTENPLDSICSPFRIPPAMKRSNVSLGNPGTDLGVQGSAEAVETLHFAATVATAVQKARAFWCTFLDEGDDHACACMATFTVVALGQCMLHGSARK